MCDDTVNLILYVSILCKNFSLLYLLYNSIHKLKTLSVSRFYCRFIFEINIPLHIRCFLTFSS